MGFLDDMCHYVYPLVVVLLKIGLFIVGLYRVPIKILAASSGEKNVFLPLVALCMRHFVYIAAFLMEYVIS